MPRILPALLPSSEKESLPSVLSMPVNAKRQPSVLLCPAEQTKSGETGLESRELPSFSFFFQGNVILKISTKPVGLVQFDGGVLKDNMQCTSVFSCPPTPLPPLLLYIIMSCKPTMTL